MQWTALRYLTVCEGFRSDVTVFNAPMMSFDWFASQRALYPHVTFPGTHLAKSMSQPHGDGAFSIEDFLVANAGPESESLADREARVRRYVDERYGAIRAFRPRDWHHATLPSGGLFYAGDFMFPVNESLVHGVHAGLARRVALGPEDASTAHSAVLQGQIDAWHAMEEVFNPPGFHEYALDTWEWTTGEDFMKQAEAFSAQVLEASVRDEENPFAPGVLEGARLMEAVVARIQSANKTVSTAVWKNLGLAYTKLVKGRWSIPTSRWRPILPALGRDGSWGVADDEYRSHAALRVVECWSAFVNRPDARTDPGYPTIVRVLQALQSAQQKRAVRTNGT